MEAASCQEAEIKKIKKKEYYREACCTVAKKDEIQKYRQYVANGDSCLLFCNLVNLSQINTSC